MRLLFVICFMMLAISCGTSIPSDNHSMELEPLFSEIGSEEVPVWFWFAGDGPQMSLQVRLDQKIVYETTFHIRHAKRSSAYRKGQQKALEFLFTAPSAIVWQDYKDFDEITPANQNIEGYIWQAGADPDCLILGIAFCGQKSIYMNTLHFVYPYQRDESIIASGLSILTAPVGEVSSN